MIVQADTITSRNNSFVKFASSLSDKKGRAAEQSFIAEGFKLSKEAIDAKLPCTHVIINENKKDEYLPVFTELLQDEIYEKTQIIIVSNSVFEKISTEKAPQGVITIIKYLDKFRKLDIIYKEEFFIKPEEKAIVLCSVRDPSNLGAVIRSSVAFGVDRIILTDDCADIYNPKTVRSAMGSLFRVTVTAVKNLVDFIEAAQYNNRRVFAAELTDNAKSLHEAGLKNSDCVIIGNEGHGIPKEVSKKCDGSIYIPISKKTESLNASVAAAIFMWEQSK